MPSGGVGRRDGYRSDSRTGKGQGTVIQDEIIQLVDAQNRPCGTAPRRLMRRYRYWHRATYAFVLNGRGELCIQKRTLSKEVFPGYFDLASGGVVGAGEAVQVAARRELEEEIGVRGAPLKHCFDFCYTDATNHVFGSAYLVHYDGPLTLQAEEVADAFWVTPADALALHPSTPDSRMALERLIREGFLSESLSR
ncbi:NUDIX domain-containing protein [Cobetia amphilecti]|nr:NUDIX domain-containing protein [Cobetia litoralis]